MPRFDITAQIELRSPTNGREVLRDIQRQLRSGVDVSVNVRGGREAQRQMDDLRRSTQGASDAAANLGRSFTLATRRFAAFTVASRAVSLLTNNLARAVDEAIDFERELVRIAQVTGKTVNELKGLTDEITRLSVGLGVSSKDLLSVSRILAQAGIEAGDLKVAIQALAKTTLAPTFDDITKTAEGAVAILSQFGLGVRSLEAQLGSINAVAGQFAVESGDLIDAVRRFGGVFKSAGGDLDELLALFTSIRSTTRESAESIGTGLRTIFTRIQRPATLQFLEELGVKLTDVNGKFVGPLKAAELLSKEFGKLGEGDIRFVQIAEELGGFRQIGKVIPLLREYARAEEALKVAQEGRDSLNKDAVTAQQALSVQIQATRENFLALIRELTDTGSFRTVTASLLGVANAFIEITRALKPLLPLLTGLVAFKSIGFLGRFAAGARGALGAQTRNAGGRILGFNSGGYVPGSGNRDTVPAMLTPGEFVIKKSSAAKLGSGTLEAMNQNRFKEGGVVDNLIKKQPSFGVAILEQDRPSLLSKGSIKSGDSKRSLEIFNALRGTYSLPDKDLTTKGQPKSTSKFAGAFKNPYRYLRQGLGKKANEDFNTSLNVGIVRAVNSTAKEVAAKLGLDEPKGIGKKDQDQFLKGINTGTRGNLFEDVLTVLKGPPFTGGDPNATFDYAGGIGGTLARIYDKLPEGLVVDAKASYTESEPAKVSGKAINETIRELKSFPDFAKQKLGLIPFTSASSLKDSAAATSKRIKSRKKNAGGSISGSGDTVPALLTPGEFVVNKKSAQSIGYGNLARMNRDGVSRFAKGGAVGVQKFAGGGGVLGSAFNPTALFALSAAAQTLASLFEQFSGTVDEADQQLSKTKLGINAVIGSLASLAVIFLATKKAKEYFNSFGKGLQDSTDKIKQEAEARQSESGGAGGAGTGGGDSDEDDGVNKELKKRTTLEQKIEQAYKKSGTATKRLDDNQTFLSATNKKLLDNSKKLISAEKNRTLALNAQQAATREAGRLRRSGVSQSGGGTDAEKARLRALEANARQMKQIVAVEDNRISVLKRQNQSLQKTNDSLSDNSRKLRKNEQATRQSLSRRIATERDLNNVTDRGKGIVSRTVSAMKRSHEARKAEARDMGRVTRGVYGLATSLKPVGAGFRQLTKEVKRLRSEAKKGLGVGGKLARGFGKAASLGSAGLGGALALGAIGGQIAAGIAQFQGREKDRAIKAGNVSGAIGSAEKESIANSIGDVFTAAGFIEAATDSEGFVQRRDENRRRAKVEAGQEALQGATEFANKQLLEGAFNNEDGSVNTSKFVASQQKGFDALRNSISELPTDQERKQANDKFLAQAKGSLQNLVNAGASLEDVQRAAALMSGGLGENSEKLKKFAADIIATRDALQQVNKANIESLKITSAFNSANVAVQTFANTITAGADPLQGFFNTFSASKTNVGIDASAAITAIEDDLVSAARNAGAGDLADAISGQAGVARSLNEFSRSVGQRISTGQFRNGAAGKGELEAALLEGVDDPRIRKAVSAKVNALSDDAIATTDISQFVLDIQQEVGKLSKGFEQGAQALLAHNKQMNQLYAQREKLEQDAANAQIKAIDIQLQAAKISEQFGGPKVDPSAVSAARVAQFNAVGGLAGVQATTGSAQDISRIRDQLSTQFFAQQQAALVNIFGAGQGIVQRGLFGGPEGRQEDIRPESQAAQEALIKLTQQQIEARKQELELIKKKNAAEKSALDKLISGDVAGFIQQQEAAGAAAALQTGNAGLASLFDASSLGAGFKALQTQGDATLAAAEATLGAFGIRDSTSAGVLAGQTPEEQAAQKEIRSLATQLGGIAQDQAEFAASNIQIQDATIEAANVTFSRTLRQTSEANQRATGFAKGGTVYASQGMFIPRGTDTVPAMLTPGEFVVNRAAVQRGNNLQMLQAMNSGGGASSPTAKSGGGSVRYYDGGGFVSAITGAFSSAIPSLQGIFDSFNRSVEALSTTKFSVQLDPVTINIEGGSFLQTMKKEIRNELLTEVGRQLQNGKINNTGSFTTSSSVLNPPTA